MMNRAYNPLYIIRSDFLYITRSLDPLYITRSDFFLGGPNTAQTEKMYMAILSKKDYTRQG